MVSPDGFERSSVTANGIVPAPLISGNIGDRFLLNVTDSLTDPTMDRAVSIHWHGFFQAHSNEMDGPAFVNQCPIVPEHSFLYNFTVPDQAGTFWYHSHLSVQYCDGLRGPFVVYDPNDPLKHLYDIDNEETIITLGDWYHTVAPTLMPNQKSGTPTPDSTIINGLGKSEAGGSLAIVRAQPGKRHRFRLINSGCLPFFTFSIDNHNLTIIEADGIEHDPVTVDSLEIFVAQRYSFILTADQPVDNYWIRALPQFPGGATTDNGFNSAILRYDGAPDAEPTSTEKTNPTLLNEAQLHPLINPGAPGIPIPGAADVNMHLQVTHSGGRFGVNDVPFNPLVFLCFFNISGQAGGGNFFHPFHLHGHAFDVIRVRDNDTYNFINPVRRDVVSIGGGGSNMTFRFFTDNPGPWYRAHCHIDWHLESGLAVVLAEDPDGTPAWTPPGDDWLDLCPLYDALNPDKALPPKTIRIKRSSSPAWPQQKKITMSIKGVEIAITSDAGPSLKSSNNHDVRAELNVVNANLAPDGTQRSTVTVNGQFPGPLISGFKGDRFLINVRNRLSDPTMNRATSLHWHGIHQTNSREMDGTVSVTQCPIVPGHDFLYNFTIPDQAGTFWYHSHIAAQYCDGLRGPLIVYDPDDPHKQLYDIDNEQTIISISDWYHTPSPQSSGGMHNTPYPDSTLINGLGRSKEGGSLAVIRGQPGKRHRFRIINTSCYPSYKLSIDGHRMMIIEADGVETQPLIVDQLTIHAGQRYSVIVSMDRPIGNYWIRAIPSPAHHHHNSIMQTTEGGINSAILRYDGATSGEPLTGPVIHPVSLREADLHPFVGQGPPGHPHVGGADIVLYLKATYPGKKIAINGVPFNPPTIPVLLQLLSGANPRSDLDPSRSVYILPANKTVEIVFSGGGEHPFHLHGHTFDVIRVAGESTYNFNNPVRRDTVNTGSHKDNVTIRFVTDNAGPWMLVGVPSSITI
ncbi:laccase [Pyrrhoderma noxium]|uniref:Laccase n=1 Tax=Pyrrhoderma noxium TaxID=2282107 RepID=A0A286UJR2_9AGAM|nr:laccase [Pyrrhoderma noxium]